MSRYRGSVNRGHRELVVQWKYRNGGSVNRGLRGTEDQRNSETRGTVRPEEQWVQRGRGTLGTEEQWAQRTRGIVGTKELFNKFLDKHPQKARLCQEHHIDPEDDNIDLA